MTTLYFLCVICIQPTHYHHQCRRHLLSKKACTCMLMLRAERLLDCSGAGLRGAVGHGWRRCNLHCAGSWSLHSHHHSQVSSTTFTLLLMHVCGRTLAVIMHHHICPDSNLHSSSTFRTSLRMFSHNNQILFCRFCRCQSNLCSFQWVV